MPELVLAEGVTLDANPSTAPRYITIVETASEILPDHSIVELVADPSQPSRISLLRWAGDQATIEPRVLYGDTAYFPIRLQPSLQRVLRLPSGCSPTLNLTELLRDLSSSAKRFIGLTGSDHELLALAVLATWIPEASPSPFALALWCPNAGEAAQIARWLHCVCRRALPLSDVSGRDLVRISDGLDPTPVLFRPNLNSRILESIAAHGWRGICTARDGKLSHSIGAKIFVMVDRPLDRTKMRPNIEITVPPGRGSISILDAAAEYEIAQHFQPALLRYRLSRLSSMGHDVSQPTPATSSVSGFPVGFASYFLMEPELDRQISLLTEAEEAVTKGSVDINHLLVEVLLARSHESGRQAIHVAEILIDLKAAFVAYGEESDASERFVGALLKALGFRTKPLDREGRGLKLDGKNRRRIHELARGYRLRSAEQPFPGCAECAKSQVSEH